MRHNSQHGVSLVGTIVGIAIFLLVFLTLYASFHAMLTFSERNRLRANALFLVNEHLEYIRALPYDSIGTIAGLPSGAIPQNETIVFDNHSYDRRTFIQYVDDDADGSGGADLLPVDYKRVKVEISYEYRGSTQSFSMVTTMAPKSQESLIGAGVLRIQVTDADNDPVPSAQVHIVNNTVATSVDITTFTNASGTVSFPGAWAGPGYEVYVSKAGYSDAQTYTSTTTNPNPSPSPFNVPENGTTEVFFKIDLLSQLNIFTRAWPIRQTFFDDFFDGSKLTTLSNVQVTGNELVLTGAPGSYALSGTATSLPVSPASLGTWLLLSFDDFVPANTAVSYHIEYDTGGGVFALIPDSDLPQNSTGFTVSPVDLGALNTTVYQTLRVVTNLATTDTTVTPEVLEYTLSYHETDVPIGNVTFSLTSGTTIGTDTSGEAIYRYDETHQTSGVGLWSSGDLPFDTYTLSLSGYAIAEACPPIPIVLEPDTTLSETITLAPSSTHTLKVRINNPLSAPVERASVRIVGGAIDMTRSTGACGIAYFPSLPEATYDVYVEAPALQESTDTIAVSGETETVVTLSF